jgi:hypothetical protein
VPYFGFLVPTPSQPKLSEAPDELFQVLEDWSKPEIITKKVPRPRKPLLSRGLTESAPPAAGAVHVLDEQRVGGFDAVVLKADDARAMKEWLEKHGYVTRPDLEKWLEPYIKQGWIITAFQIAKPDKTKPDLSTQAVRMTFQTERPFYPYAEPGDQRDLEGHHPGRLLRIFFVSTARMEGKLEHPTTTWPGRAAWANTLSPDQRDKMLTLLGGPKKMTLPEKPWLTVFDDQSSPRPGVADLFFAPASDQSTLARPPIIDYVFVDETAPMVWWTGAVVLGGTVLIVGMILATWRFALRNAPPVD